MGYIYFLVIYLPFQLIQVEAEVKIEEYAAVIKRKEEIKG